MPKAKPCKDHLGNKYKSFSDMCRHYNIDSTKVLYRINRLNWSLGDALTKESIKPNAKVCYDHLGNSYKSFKDMCKHYNKDVSTVHIRVSKCGWSLEDALTKEEAHGKLKLCCDHLGNKYKSFSEMCKYYNKKHSTVKSRLRIGWNLEDALTKNNMEHNNITVFGIKYRSISETAKKYNIGIMTLTNRLLRSGWDIELACVYPSTAPKLYMYYIGIDNIARYKQYSSNNIYTVVELISKYAPQYLDLYKKTNPMRIYHPYIMEEF